MKLIIGGASGFVGTELIRQSIRRDDITEVIALARRPVSLPQDIEEGKASKFRSVIIEDYEVYTEEVKAQLAGADACIWWANLFFKFSN